MSKLKVCNCTANGTITFYQDSNGKQLSNPQKYTNRDSSGYHGYSPQYNLENNRFSYQQIHLYEKCVYGLQVCTPKEIAQMSLKEKAQLIHNHKKTQQLINLSKWKATSDMVKDTFNKAFPHLCPWIQKFLNSTDEILEEDDLVLNKAPLKIIGGRDNLINNLIKNKILPSNFYNLKTA